MNAVQIIDELKAEGVELKLEGVNIRVQCQNGDLTAAQKNTILDHKSILIDHLSPKSVETLAVYKKCKRPDGTVVDLNKEEFDNVVDLFRMLLKQDRKLRQNKKCA